MHKQSSEKRGKAGGQRQGGTMLDKNMCKNNGWKCLDLIKTINPQIQKAQQTPSTKKGEENHTKAH